MKLKDYIKRLNEIMAEDPKNENLEVVYSIDEEGNAFHSVYNDPTVGFYFSNEFISVEDAKDPYFEGEYDNKTPNSLCIN